MTDRFEVLCMYCNLRGECLQMLLVGAFFFFSVGQGKAGWRESWLLMGALVSIQNI